MLVDIISTGAIEDVKPSRHRKYHLNLGHSKVRVFDYESKN